MEVILQIESSNISIIVLLQISDFGLARDLSGDGIYQSQGGSIPVKWTAPEVRDCVQDVHDIGYSFCLSGWLYVPNNILYMQTVIKHSHSPTLPPGPSLRLIHQCQ